jgi:purine-nucleoside phosphorylase
MEKFFSFEEFNQAASYVKNKTNHKPTIGLVLGSGLGSLAKEVLDADRIPYGDIPHWPVSTVSGHAGELVIGKLANKTVLIMRGRTHFYEGYSIQQITLPIRVMQLIGIRTVMLTNAAGGLRQDFKAGDLMLISDHINMIGMGGTNPLRGPNDERLGPRFPDMSHIYDPELRAIAARVAIKNQIPIKEGIYIGLAGPSFESPADLRFLHLIGANAVGMSTVPEAITARHGGLRVLGISGITNIPAKEPSNRVMSTHEEVLETGKLIGPRMLTVIRGVLESIPNDQSSS